LENIVDIHDNVFEFLEEYKQTIDEKGTQFFFTLRRSNQESRLEKGYWFYGNDYYMAVSFWSGMDWKNKTPNIYFSVNSEGRIAVTFTAKDSIQKAEYIEKYFVKELKLERSGKFSWLKSFQTDDYIKALQDFLGNDKIIIDKIIKSNQNKLKSEDESNSIGFINKTAFKKWFDNIKKYREEDGEYKLPYSLTSFSVEKYKPIDKASFGRMSRNTQFIFLVGENGSGKSSLLKSLATALGNKFYNENNDPDNSLWIINYSLNIEGRTQRSKITSFNPIDKKHHQIPFAGFGPSRLMIQNRMFTHDKGILARMDSLRSLFHSDAILKDINRWIINELAKNNSKSAKENSKLRFENIKQMLVTIVPNLYDIRETPWDDTQELLYFEEDLNGEKIEKGVIYEHLSSGLRSLIAMLGDMMLRMFEQQPKVNDPAELAGIVLIDEIDIHLHPKWQKKVPEILSENFPKIQFIVTTHSPIPLLGAPKKSRIYVVRRTAQEGVAIDRMDNRVMFEELLPNAILTSPIFDLEEIIPDSHNKNKLIRTEDTYKEVLENDELRIQLKEIARKLRKS
jgi:predicted ATP-binding protein involved in virulence